MLPYNLKHSAWLNFLRNHSLDSRVLDRKDPDDERLLPIDNSHRATCRTEGDLHRNQVRVPALNQGWHTIEQNTAFAGVLKEPKPLA
jgi:hypothetical protein